MLVDENVNREKAGYGKKYWVTEFIQFQKITNSENIIWNFLLLAESTPQLVPIHVIHIKSVVAILTLGSQNCPTCLLTFLFLSC